MDNSVVFHYQKTTRLSRVVEVEHQPLGRALTLALRLLIDDMHVRLDAAGFTDLRPAHGYVLNAAAQDGGVTASALAAILGMTKQGAAKVIGELVRAGYLQRSSSDTDGRAHPMTLTERGADALAAAAAVQDELEQEWISLSSARDVAALRRVVSRVLEAHDADVRPPPLRPVW
jgi:DNA-binding MarR family transcriptional regulator